MFVSQPVAVELKLPRSQLAYPGSQLAMEHSPVDAHTGVECGTLQGSHEAAAQPVCTSSSETHTPLQSLAQTVLPPPLPTLPPVDVVPPLDVPPPPLPEVSSLVEPPHATIPPSAPRRTR